jgi:nitrite reductase (NADH) small subunit
MSAGTATAFVHVGPAADVPLLEGRTVSLDGRRIAVFRLADGWAAVDAECPHRGGPLQDGIVGERCVTCPLHNRRYDLRDGELRTHDVEERDGGLWVRVR